MRNQINSDVFSIFTVCKSLLFAKSLGHDTASGTCGASLIFSNRSFKTAYFENGFFVGNIVKSEGVRDRFHALSQYP